MKHIIRLLLLLSIASGCNTNSDVALTCQLTSIDKGVNNKYAYTYDGQGRISQMTRNVAGSTAGSIQEYVYTFAYDTTGRLLSSVWTVDKKAGGTAKYTHADGRLVRADYVYANGTKGFSTLRYYVNGRLSEFSTETPIANASGKRYFEYDANGIITKTGFSDPKGLKYFEVVTQPVGLVKSPEQLIAKKGLPYDVLTGYPWQGRSGGVGTTFSVYYSSSTTGQLVLSYTGTTTALQTNGQAFLTELTSTEQGGKVTTERYTLASCN